MFIRAALSCMALALVEHTFMTTEPDDHEWRYGHGDTLHGLYFLSLVFIRSFNQKRACIASLSLSIMHCRLRHKSYICQKGVYFKCVHSFIKAIKKSKHSSFI
jgi:hypothetical protein